MSLLISLLLAARTASAQIPTHVVGCGCVCGIVLETPCGPCDCARACRIDPCDPGVKAEGCGGCKESSSGSGSSGSSNSSPGLSLPPPRNMQEAMVQGVYQGMMNAMQAAPAAIQQQANITAQSARSLNAAQAQQGQAAEEQMHNAAQREQAEEEQKRQQAGGLIHVPSREPVAPAPPGESGDGSVRLFGDTPMLLAGDPQAACRQAAAGKRRSPLCLDSASDVPPPLGDSEDARRARAMGETLQGECDAPRDHDNLGTMQEKLKEYLQEKAKETGMDKAKDYLEEKAQEIGLPVEEFKRASEGGGILRNYATKTMHRMSGQAQAAACALGTSSASCLDDYYEHESAIHQDAQDLKRDTGKFVADQFGANKPSAEAAGRFLSLF